MKINCKKLILLLYFIGMLTVLLRGLLVYELGNEQFITITGRVISLVQISIIILLLLIYKNISKKTSRKPRDIIIFRWTLITFWIINMSLDLINTKTINISLIYFSLMIIFFLLIDYDHKFFNKVINLTFFTFVFICIISLVFMCFGYGVQVNGEYLEVSKIGIRLYGMTQHANSLGPIASLVCIYSFYKKKKLFFVVGIITLWYTQSKTNIIILLVCLAMEWFRWIFKKINKRDKRYIYSFFLVGLIVIGIMMLGLDIISKLEFTGRISTWEYYLNAWQSNLKTILMGCNSDMIFLKKYAENMYVDMLARYGILGFVVFIYLLGIIFKITWKNARKGYFLSFTIYIFIILRSITESIFINTNMGFGDFFNFVFLIIINETYLHNSNLIKEKYEKESDKLEGTN